jgi:hypothetical protein
MLHASGICVSRQTCTPAGGLAPQQYLAMISLSRTAVTVPHYFRAYAW